MTTCFSAPINPERPRGAPTCTKCASCFTWRSDADSTPRLGCALGREPEPCSEFRDASVERTERRGLKQGYDVVRVA